MCYATFGAAAWKSYTLPLAWSEGLVLLRHTIGLGMIALQAWVAFSVYDQLGEYGWFYGDFFFDHSPKLTYGGIYRFLNNPERVLGLAGLWGCTLITQSSAIFGLASISLIGQLFTLELVERPHMTKLYGRHLRQDSGLSRSLKRSLPPPLRHWQDTMEKLLGETLDTIEEYLDAAKPQVEASIGNVVGPTKDWLSKYPTHMSSTSIDPTIANLESDHYSIELTGDQPQFSTTCDDSIMQLEYGSPIKVRWTAPMNHGKRDWIALYSLASRNTSKEVTNVPSHGRWIATNFGEYDDVSSEQGLLISDVKTTKKHHDVREVELLAGEMLFTGDKLCWEQGIFEFRYHHNGKHNVMAISQPFEVRIPRINEDDLELLGPFGEPISNLQNEELIRNAIEKALLPVVRNCFERDPDIAPSTPYETYGGLVDRDGKYARRVVYAIQHMFGIEFAPQVVKADGQISNLAWRILEAEKVLQPYSMSKSRGTSTPIEQ